MLNMQGKKRITFPGLHGDNWKIWSAVKPSRNLCTTLGLVILTAHIHISATRHHYDYATIRNVVRMLHEFYCTVLGIVANAVSFNILSVIVH